MKGIMIIAAVFFCVAGCGDGFDPVKVRGAVADQHPGAQVQQIPGNRSWKYLVKEPNGRVLYVEYMGSTLEPTAKVIMFDAP